LHAEDIKKTPVWLSWSSGKDSAFALIELSKHPKYAVTKLFTVVTGEFERVSMHSTRIELLNRQAEMLNLPLETVVLPFPCSNEEYEQQMLKLINKAKSENITTMAFGDLYLEDVRSYRVTKLDGTGIGQLASVWKIIWRSSSVDGRRPILLCKKGYSGGCLIA